VLRAALLLHRLTGTEEYLRKAENVAHYLMTWCFYHDVPFAEGTDCALLGVQTTGGTSVSAAHHHLDCWGAYYVPDMAELFRHQHFVEERQKRRRPNNGKNSLTGLLAKR
jgi:hypothetical protein